jgi:LytS/YehU family sensor histidine kinase
VVYFLGIYKHLNQHLVPDVLFVILWNNVGNSIFVGPVAVCGLFLSVKMLKNWYLKEEEKQLLITANANAEMQLLKAQIHPHFLFNTLNNIYSFTLNKSPVAGDMVLQLSSMVNYMIADCNAEFVLLQQELKMLNDYINLEKVRYGNRLDLQITITGEIANKQITPLLMIPFIENSFKHGTSKMLKEPWIKLFIQADENILHFSLTNSKPINANKNGNGGIGLNNVKKRLELLYPNTHLLIVEPTEHTYTVNMQVPLEKI